VKYKVFTSLSNYCHTETLAYIFYKYLSDKFFTLRSPDLPICTAPQDIGIIETDVKLVLSPTSMSLYYSR